MLADASSLDVRLHRLCLPICAHLLAVSIATRVISIFSDGLVVFLTWKKTFRIYALTRHAKLHADYSVLILRDGEYRVYVTYIDDGQLMLCLQAPYTFCASASIFSCPCPRAVSLPFPELYGSSTSSP